jgi:hypothetical protein
MKHFLIVLIAVALIGLAGNRVLGAQTEGVHIALPATGGNIAQFYMNKAEHMGQFPGKLICAYDNVRAIPASTEDCSGDHRVYALQMDNGKVTHPLIADTNQMVDRIWFADLRNTNVVVAGKYYPTTGEILVENIRPAPQTIAGSSMAGNSGPDRSATYMW